MTSHELAKQLLTYPDLPVVTGLTRSGYGEPVDEIAIEEAYAYKEGKYADPPVDVIELILSDDSDYSNFKD